MTRESQIEVVDGNVDTTNQYGASTRFLAILTQIGSVIWAIGAFITPILITAATIAATVFVGAVVFGLFLIFGFLGSLGK